MATENKQISTWLPPQVVEQVHERAAADRRTVSMWIRLLIEREVAADQPSPVRDAA